MAKRTFLAILTLFLLSACEELSSVSSSSTTSDTIASPSVSFDETARVTRVIDGDTIDVSLNGETVRVRYVGVNTPERDEACYQDAVNANKRLVEGQTVGLVRDESDTDQYGRLLRYVYVGETFVNQTLIVEGYAEAVLYGNDDRHWAEFVTLEGEAERANRGCHPTGIFNDGSQRR